MPVHPLRNLIGVDIGGTKIAVAAVHPSGRILARRSFPTEAELGFPRAVERLSRAIEDVDQAAATALPHPVDEPFAAGIGIGCAGPVDPIHGLINNPYTLTGWDRCDIVGPLQRRFGVPVRLENDADVAGLAESWVGAGHGANPLVMLTFGTGVGGSVIQNASIYRGAQGEHPELGHIPADPAGPPCYCGISGCLESMASGTAIGLAGRPLGLTDAREVFAAADAGHPEAATIVRRAVQATTTAAWTLFHTLLPSRLILGGGLMDTEFERFAEPIRARIRQATQFSPAHVEIRPARLGNEAGIVGAAALVRPATADL